MSAGSVSNSLCCVPASLIQSPLSSVIVDSFHSHFVQEGDGFRDRVFDADDAVPVDESDEIVALGDADGLAQRQRGERSVESLSQIAQLVVADEAKVVGHARPRRLRMLSR